MPECQKAKIDLDSFVGGGGDVKEVGSSSFPDGAVEGVCEIGTVCGMFN